MGFLRADPSPKPRELPLIQPGWPWSSGAPIRIARAGKTMAVEASPSASDGWWIAMRSGEIWDRARRPNIASTASTTRVICRWATAKEQANNRSRPQSDGNSSGKNGPRCRDIQPLRLGGPGKFGRGADQGRAVTPIGVGAMKGAARLPERPSLFMNVSSN